MSNEEGVSKKRSSNGPKSEKERIESPIFKFIAFRDIPFWFRGLSYFQLFAADNLLNALRDDSEQGTGHRVRECLRIIGLTPLLTIKEIRNLILHSKRNDLAFLWFIMELHYKPKNSKKGEYTLNEQLIMSSIAHLDMITTLRELDRLLPPPQPTKKEIERQQRLKQKSAKPKLKEQNQVCPQKPLAPYFEKQRRPKLCGKSLMATEPEFRSNITMYSHYNDPGYEIQNESNRWYTEYVLQPGLRIARRILNDLLDFMFEDYEHLAKRAKRYRSLCEHHKVIRELEKSLEAQRKVIAMERCLKYSDVKSHHQERLRKQVTNVLEHDVQIYLNKFKKMDKQSRKNFNVSTLTADSNLVKTVEEVCSSSCETPPDSICDCDCYFKSKKMKDENDENEIVKFRKYCDREIESGDFIKLFHSNDSDANSVIMDKCENKRIVQTEKCICGTVFKCIRGGKNNDKEIMYDDFSTPDVSETFFHKAEPNKSFQFDYRKIFNFKENSDEKINIRAKFVDYLDNEIALKTKQQDKDLPLDVDAAVENCVKKMWKEGVLNKRTKLEKIENFTCPNNQAKKQIVKRREKSGPPFDYGRDYYDPDDRDLMTAMLKDTLAYMAQDRKFVLASLPEAYKTPALQEWIKYRYGKVYTKLERYKLFTLSLRVFRVLDKISLHVPLPNLLDLGTNMTVDYACRGYLLEKADLIKQNYYKKLDDALMDQGRIFWFAMQPFLCSGGPPRNTFFAYSPSRVTDIMHFRIWKPNEFMDAKEAWERRRTMKRLEKKGL